jgi:hypothetical protein
MTEINPRHDVKEAVRDALNSGFDVYQQVKAITLKALTNRQLNITNITQVAEAVVHGINEGIGTQGEHAKDRFMQAASALDDALSIAAEASKLAIQEASSKMNEFSQSDLNRATEDIKAMEDLFFETLGKIARGGNYMVAEIGSDFISHARKSGTAVGKQVLSALDALKELPAQGTSTLVSGAATVTSVLAQMGSGILAGIAESLQPSQEKK